jgi:hypothetical protein
LIKLFFTRFHEKKTELSPDYVWDASPALLRMLNIGGSFGSTFDSPHASFKGMRKSEPAGSRVSSKSYRMSLKDSMMRLSGPATRFQSSRTPVSAFWTSEMSFQALPGLKYKPPGHDSKAQG